MDLHDGGDDPGPPSFFCSHGTAGEPFCFSSCFTVPPPEKQKEKHREKLVYRENLSNVLLVYISFCFDLLGDDARIVMAEAEENKRKVKVVKVRNQW